MKCNLRALSAGVLFFIGHTVAAQKKDTATGEQKIEEVVVVAFGTQKKDAIVGSVATVDKKVLQNQQATSVVSALQGTVAGVNLITSGGQPGENPNLYIRGIGSINASTQPLIVVDGVPFNGNLNSIPQEQVESMSVLKDASSTALYGSRASNGVIVITTKKGRRNSAPSVSLTSLAGVSSPGVKLHETLNAEQYMQYSWQALRNNEVYTNGLTPQAAGVAASNALISSLGYNPYNVANPIDANGNLVNGAQLLWDTDWEEEILNKAAFKQEHRFTVSGGDDKSTYFLGADYLSMDGTVKTSNFERTGVRLNLESQVKDWLKVGLNTAYSASSQNYPIQSGSTYASSIQWIYSVANIYPLYRRDVNGAILPDGFGNPQYDYGSEAISQSVNGGRPLFENENAVGALYNNRNLVKRTNLNANGFLEFDITRDLTFKTLLGYEQYLLDGNYYDHYGVGAAASVKGRVEQERTLGKTVNFTNSLNYNKKFGDHSLGAQGIFEVYQFTYDVLTAQGTGFLPNVFVLNGSTTPESVGGYVNRERMVSYLGRLTYNYQNKYFVEGSYRRDGSTKFSPETRWGDFYSAGASWVVSNEDFFQNDVVNNFKLKASYGELGNNRGIGYFPYLTLFETGWNQLGETGVLLSGVNDALLTWEKTASTNVGVDFGLFNNRLVGNIEYFNKKSIDLIYAQPLPGSTGNTSITTNVGSIRNYGWEATLTSVNFRRPNFEWTTTLNASFVKNEIVELTQESFQNGTKRWAVGQSLYDFYIPVWAGVDPADGMGMWYTNETDANGNVTQGTTKDYNVANVESNKQYVGSSLPDVTGGLSNNFRIHNFDISALINYSFGSYVYDSSYAGLMAGFSRPGYQQSVDVMNAWQQPGDITDIPVNIQRQNNNNATSTRFLFKNDYVRLKALTIGYNVAQEKIERFGANQLRLFIQGDNLWTWQSHKGIDPEQSIAGTTDNRSYLMKTISLGFTLGF